MIFVPNICTVKTYGKTSVKYKSTKYGMNCYYISIWIFNLICYILRKNTNKKKISDKINAPKNTFSLRSPNTHHNIPFSFEILFEPKAKGSSILEKFAQGFFFLFHLGFTKVYFYFEGVSKICESIKKGKKFF